jgi:hypothetical protein
MLREILRGQWDIVVDDADRVIGGGDAFLGMRAELGHGLDEPTAERIVVGLTATVDLVEGWTARFVFDVSDAEAQKPSILLTSSDDSPPLSSQLLSRFRLTGLQQRVIRTLPLVLGVISPGQSTRFVAARPGRRGRPDEQYALWAQDYVNACAIDDKPVKRLAQEHAGTTGAVWRRRLKEAEHRGLLIGRPKGNRPGGRLSADAKRLIKGITQ